MIDKLVVDFTDPVPPDARVVCGFFALEFAFEVCQAPWNVVRLFLSVIFLDVVEFVFPVLLVPIFRGPPVFGVRVLIVPTALVLPPGSVLLVVHVQPGLGDRVPLVPSDLGLLGGLVPLGSLVPPGGLVPLEHVGFVCLVLGDHAPPATDDFVPPDWVKSS